jgi:hypothetical protein
VEYLVGETERVGLKPDDLREIVEDQVKAWEEEKKKL